MIPEATALDIGALTAGLAQEHPPILSSAMLPFILKKIGFDPASSSAPCVATLIAVTGLVIYFSIALFFLRGTLLCRARSDGLRNAGAGAEIEACRFELAAGCHDVAAARRADRARIARAIHRLGEFLDLLPLRALKRCAGPRVERDQVDLGRDLGEQPHQLLGVGALIVDASQHHVFEGDTFGI